jgi:BASS family bile acid:Na+ symporter
LARSVYRLAGKILIREGNHGAVRVRDFFGNNALMMIVALVIAMLFGGFPEAYPKMNKDVAMASLMVMMSFSLCSMQMRGLKLGAHRVSVRNAFLLSFVLSTGATIAMAFLFTGDLRNGWILAAAVPSAVSVIPFTLILGGDMEGTLVSSAALYIIALVLTPILTLVFIGHAVSVETLLWYVLMLIAVPVVVSRGLRRVKIDPYGRSVAINISFAVLVIAVAGANREVFFGEPGLLLALIAVAVIKTFGIGVFMDWYGKRKKVAWEQRVPQVLFATHKNTGMAAALAIALLGAQAAMPAAVCMTVDIAWLIFVSRFMFSRDKKPGPAAAQ